jgi:hypothetical protein
MATSRGRGLVVGCSATDLDLVILVIRRLRGVKIAARRPAPAHPSGFALAVMGFERLFHLLHAFADAARTPSDGL